MGDCRKRKEPMPKTKKKSKKKAGAPGKGAPSPGPSPGRPGSGEPTESSSAQLRKRARAEAAAGAAGDSPAPVPRLAPRRGVRSVLPRIVPWRDWAEWDAVRAGLLGADAREAARAVGRVRAWQSRGRVPHSVEATATLVEIGLARAAAGGRSENELRLMYSMAIVRLVNGIVDAVQQKKFAAPVSDLAGRVALPRVLVDIRHTASHNALPSLAALSLAAHRALEWLGQHYWGPQAAALQSSPATTVEPLLRQLVHVQSQLLAARQAHDARLLAPDAPRLCPRAPAPPWAGRLLVRVPAVCEFRRMRASSSSQRPAAATAAACAAAACALCLPTPRAATREQPAGAHRQERKGDCDRSGEVEGSQGV